MKTMRDKYMVDPQYRSLVDHMTAAIVNNNFTPSEMREAAVMASINYEMLHVKNTVHLHPDTESAFRILRNVESQPSEHYDPATGD